MIIQQKQSDPTDLNLGREVGGGESFLDLLFKLEEVEQC